MLNDNPTADPEQPSADETPDIEQASASDGELKGLAQIWEGLVRIGLGETALRVGTSIISISLFLIVIWVMSNFYLDTAENAPRQGALAAALPSPTPTIDPASIALASPGIYAGGITRLALLHTILPTRPRFEVVQYTVQEGDTIFGIAEKFNLHPETILWGNLEILGDNPHFLQPGQQLNILPVDGVYHKWSAGEGLNGVAKYYGVQPVDIINWPGNQLTAEAVGDFAAPNIEPGSMLVVPGGKREFSSWATPRITRDEPAKAKNIGPGYCGEVYTGLIGTGNFIFPAPNHFLSGYDYSPSTNHFGLDFDGETGDPIFASDHGVVVYAGWNDFGYGNMVVIDHGNGWQSLYAHLDSVAALCGQSVYQGTVIGPMGSTGRSSGSHLHFEMRSDQYGKVNPWDFLH